MSNTDFLRDMDPGTASAYECVFEGEGQLKALTETEQALILLGLFAVHGDTSDVRTHGDRALRSGATPEAVLEVVLAAAISQGVRALSTSRAYISELVLAWPPGEQFTPAGATAYLRREFGELPKWTRSLAKASPEFMAGYASIRERILREGAARRRTKELLTMALNAVGGNQSGIVSHGSAALRHGAENAHLLETLLLAVRVGGIVAWITGIQAIEHLVSPTGDG